MNSTCTCSSLKGGGRGSRLHVWDEDADKDCPLKRRGVWWGGADGAGSAPWTGPPVSAVPRGLRACGGRTSLAPGRPARTLSRPAPPAGTSAGRWQLPGSRGFRGPRPWQRNEGRAPGPEAKRGEASAEQLLFARQCRGKFRVFFFKSLLRNLTGAADCRAPKQRGAQAQPAVGPARLYCSETWWDM